MNHHDPVARLMSPEWVTTRRTDFHVNPSLAGGWDVSPTPLARGANFTDFSTHEMGVPTGDSLEARAVRLHEMIHAATSPTSVPVELLNQLGVSMRATRVAEELRVNFIGRRVSNVFENIGVPADDLASLGDTRYLTDGSEIGFADRCVETANWQDALTLFLHTWNTDVHRKVRRRLRRNVEWREPLEVVEKYLTTEDWNVDKYVYGARYYHRSATVSRRYVYVDGKTRTEREVLLPWCFVNDTLPLAERIDSWLDTPPLRRPPKGALVARRSRPEQVPQQAGWEVLRFGMTSLTETTTAFLGKRKRPAMVGKFPVRPDRMLTDPERRVFREVVRSHGGVVVFDCSGSMSVDIQDVRDVVKQFAGATVVAYTFSRKNEANAWVLARNGRMVNEAQFAELDLNHGNGVDGPILRWAVRQRKTPKDFVIWVSDGAVTGTGDVSSQDLVRECAQLSSRYNIIGVEDAVQAIELLAEMKRTGKVPTRRYCRIIQSHLKTFPDADYSELTTTRTGEPK